MTFKKKVIEEVVEDEVEDEVVESPLISLKEKAGIKGDKTNRYSRATPIILNGRIHDPRADWEVDHSGTDDPEGNGPPKYDESPVKGGFIISSGYMHSMKGENINANGHEIDPDDTSGLRGTAVVIDPERYKGDEPDFS